MNFQPRNSCVKLTFTSSDIRIHFQNVIDARINIVNLFIRLYKLISDVIVDDFVCSDLNASKELEISICRIGEFY